MSTTIAAISTAPTNGGIGIVRMSGKNCFTILEKIFIPKQKQKIEDIPGYSMKYGYVIDYQTKEKIDEVLVSFFKEPKSYTTENMCEINCHGGVIVEQKILEQCLMAGAELAEPGEFTKRAFLNGRIDLSQAEGIIDLINAKTTQEAKISFHQLEGGLSQKIQEIRKDLLSMMADIEANIDYPEYEIEEETSANIEKILSNIKDDLTVLERSFNTGKILKEGIDIAIIGKPNSGKSSLLNYILKEERAIVTNIEGTTRDTIEENINIDGIPFKIIDTAGIRKSDDEIENLGIQKSRNLAQKAELIIAIFDSSREFEEEDEEILNLVEKKNAIIVLNKIDLKKVIEKDDIKIKEKQKPIVEISTVTGEGIPKIYEEIIKMFKTDKIKIDNETMITNIRHKNIISTAIEEVDKALKVITKKEPIDIVSIYMRETIEQLNKITGESVTEDIINEIFSKFCLGK